jgi:hypothetical protein
MPVIPPAAESMLTVLFASQVDLVEPREADALFDHGLGRVIAGAETRTGQPPK